MIYSTEAFETAAAFELQVNYITTVYTNNRAFFSEYDLWERRFSRAINQHSFTIQIKIKTPRSAIILNS